MKKLLSLLLCLALTAGVLAVPAAAAGIEVTEDISVSADYDWTRFAGQGIKLNVYNWGEYIADGSDESADVVSAFEQLTGIEVNYTTFDSNESMYAKIKSGAADYDVIFPSDYMVSRMINEEMLKRCRGKRIVAADSSKIGKLFNFSTAPISSIDLLVTDSGIAPEHLTKFKDAGLEVVLADTISINYHPGP